MLPYFPEPEDRKPPPFYASFLMVLFEMGVIIYITCIHAYRGTLFQSRDKFSEYLLSLVLVLYAS